MIYYGQVKWMQPNVIRFVLIVIFPINAIAFGLNTFFIDISIRGIIICATIKCGAHCLNFPTSKLLSWNEVEAMIQFNFDSFHPPRVQISYLHLTKIACEKSEEGWQSGRTRKTKEERKNIAEKLLKRSWNLANIYILNSMQIFAVCVA